MCVDPGSGKEFMDDAGYVDRPPYFPWPVVDKDLANPRPGRRPCSTVTSPSPEESEKEPSGTDSASCPAGEDSTRLHNHCTVLSVKPGDFMATVASHSGREEGRWGLKISIHTW